MAQNQFEVDQAVQRGGVPTNSNMSQADRWEVARRLGEQQSTPNYGGGSNNPDVDDGGGVVGFLFGAAILGGIVWGVYSIANNDPSKNIVKDPDFKDFPICSFPLTTNAHNCKVTTEREVKLYEPDLVYPRSVPAGTTLLVTGQELTRPALRVKWAFNNESGYVFLTELQANTSLGKTQNDRGITSNDIEIKDNTWIRIDIPGGKIGAMPSAVFNLKNQGCLYGTQVTAMHRSDGWGVIKSENLSPSTPPYFYVWNGTIQRDFNMRPYMNGPPCP